MPSSVHETLLDGLAARYRERYGVAVFDVAVEPLEGGGVRVVGHVLLPGQKEEVLAALEATPAVDEVAVLADPACPPLAWAVPAHPRIDLRRAPSESAELSTQALDGDAAMRLLWREDDWRLVQLWDHTIGWAHGDAIREVSTRGEAHPWEGVRRAVVGATVAVDVPVERLLDAARARIGQPYLLGGASDEGLDCSALVQRVYWSVAQLLLPKHTGDQRRMGVRVSRSAVEPGDLLFFKSRDRDFGHVALAVDRGGGELLHASLRNGCVTVEPFETVLGTYAYLGARRIARFLTAERAVEVEAMPRGRRVPLDLSRPETLRGYNVHVLGLAGAEGAAIARFLVSHGVAGVTAHDFSTPDTFEKNFRLAHVGLSPRARGERLRELLSLPIRRCLRDEYLAGIERAEVVFLPQGWFLYDANAPIRDLRERGEAVFSQMTDLYFRLAPCPIAAVTGTNGKSTTTRLLSDLVGASPIPHLFAGNDRRNVQVLDRLEAFDRSGLLVLEVSNRQLIDLSPRPRVGVITNVTPDHVEEHGSFDAYVAVKRKMVAEAELAVLNADDPISSTFPSGGRRLFFSLRERDGEGAFLASSGILTLRLEGRDESLIERGGLRVRGDHNVANVLAASLAARLCGVGLDVIREVLPKFRGIHLRCEEVAVIDGVAWVNDLKATTPEAALAAVRSFDAPLHLIVGGGDKGLDYGALAEAIRARACHLIVLDSAGGRRIEETVGSAVRTSRVGDLEAAVEAAAGRAKAGEVVLLSPACPGLFSMFIDEARGFNALVRGRKSPPR
jgi:UDP-N-acetylmuramoylalanine--D-glutamate ligase